MTVKVADIAQDWRSNTGNPKGQILLLLFRLAVWVRSWPGSLWILGSPYLFCYVAGVIWILGVELGYKTRVGRRLRLHHGVALVVSEECVIGEDCTLRHCTTLGHREPGGPCPVLGDRVDVGAHVAILGGVTIGNDVKIAAGSVVIRDVAPGEVVAGNPAAPISRNQEPGVRSDT